MRVVHLVSSDGFAGVERYIAGLASGLAEFGDDITVIGGAEAPMRTALEPAGVIWMAGDDMREAARSLRALRDADIVHTHMSQADLVGWMRPRRLRHARHVSTRHFAGPRGRNPLARALFVPLGRSLSAQIAISDFVAQHVEPPVEVVHSGVADVEQTSDLAREPYVLAVQRLEPEKHTDDVIRAWARSSGRSEGWMLKIAGDGSQRADLAALAAAEGVADSVEFLGHSDDIDALMQRASVVIAPTRREGLGIAVLEAMAHGAPVIAAAGGGHSETVGVAAPDLLFAPGDVGSAARILDRLIHAPEHRHERGEALRVLQRSQFTLRRQVAQTRAVYERVLMRHVT